MCTHAHIEKFVMDVVTIRFKHWLVVAYPYDYHAYDIEHRYDQCRECDHDSSGGIVYYVRIVGCIADGEEYQNITQSQAPCVTHEYFSSVICLSEDVVVEEGDQYSQRSKRQQSVYPHPINQKEAAKHK